MLHMRRYGACGFGTTALEKGVLHRTHSGSYAPTYSIYMGLAHNETNKVTIAGWAIMLARRTSV